jgi:hypothetical protein
MRENHRIPQQAREDSVDQLFQMAQRLLDDERARGRNLEAKTSTLAGFTGAILALTAGLGRDLFELDLGSIGDTVFRGFFLVAVLALATSAVVAVLGVLRPQERLGMKLSQLQQFATFPLISTPRVEIQGNMIATLVEAFDSERRVNDRKAKLTHYAAVGLGIGLVAVTGEAVTVALATLE